jgi:2-dehydropantoate 2-reductase
MPSVVRASCSTTERPGPSTTVLTLQNGVGCEEVVASVLGADRVIAGRTFVGGRLIEPGCVEFGIRGRSTTIGELDGSDTQRIRDIAKTFTDAGMATGVTDDVESMMWEKLLVNVATGAWSALTGLPHGFKASMLQSIDRGSRTEVDVVVRRGGSRSWVRRAHAEVRRRDHDGPRRLGP